MTNATAEMRSSEETSAHLLEVLDRDIKVAQLAKTRAEVDIANRVTPLLESIKLFSSLVIGLGGAVAGVAGFQVANAEKKEAEMLKVQAVEQRKVALGEAEKLKASQDSLKAKNDRIGSVLDDSAQVARKLHNDTGKLLHALASLQVRVALALFYQRDERIVPLLVAQASKDRNNFNGIYNAFAALSIMPAEVLRKHQGIIEPLLKLADQIGPRTQLKAMEITALLADRTVGQPSSAMRPASKPMNSER